MSDDDRIPKRLEPFDLQAPARLIYPEYSAYRAMRQKVRNIKLGHSSTEGEFTYVQRDGENDTACVTVPCEALSHPGCTYCECDNEHRVYFTAIQLRHLRELLNDTA